MALRSLVNFGDAIRTGVGVNVRYREADGLEISLCVLKRTGDIVRIIHLEAGIPTISALKDKLKTVALHGPRVHLNLEGKGLLLKRVDPEEKNIDREALTRRAFPMLRPGEILTHFYEGPKASFLHIMRTQMLTSLNEFYDDNRLISFSLGAIICNGLASVLKNKTLSLAESQIVFDHEKIVDIEPARPDQVQAPILLGEDQISVDEILAYASAWNALFPSDNDEVGGADWISNARKGFSLEVAIFRSVRIALLAVLGILFANAMVYFTLQNSKADLEGVAQASSKVFAESSVRQTSLTRLRSSFDKFGWKSNHLPVYFADQIAQLVTDRIRLTVLEVGVPEKAVVNKERRAIYRRDVLKVKGVASDPVALKGWASSIEKLPWVERVFDQKYEYEPKLQKELFEFYVQLK